MESLQRWLSNPDVRKTLVAILGLLALYVALRLARRGLNRYVEDAATRYRARKLLTLAGYFLGLLLLSLVFRNRLGGLTIFLGFAGAGVAFALREIVVSVAGWLTISLGGMYSAGDRIQLAGIRGDVIDVSILRTTLMEIGEWVRSDLYTGRIVRVPNSSVLQGPVFNFSADFPFLWDELTVPVKYGSDHRLAREILNRVVNDVVAGYTSYAAADWDYMLRRYRIESARIEPMVTLIATDNWLEFTVRYIVDYRKRRITKDEIFTQILDAIAETEGRVRLSSGTYDVVGLPDVSVRLTDERSPRDRKPSD